MSDTRAAIACAGIGVGVGCLFGLHARGAQPPNLATHLWAVVADPRPWVFVLLPVVCVAMAWRGRWHGQMNVLHRHGGRRQMALAMGSEAMGGSVLALLGVCAGVVASGTGLAPTGPSPAPWPALMVLIILLVTVTGLLGWSVGVSTATHPWLGGFTATVILVWAVCEAGLPSVAPPGGPASWALPDGTGALEAWRFLPLALTAALFMALAGRLSRKEATGPLCVAAASCLWTLAASSLMGLEAPTAQERLMAAWWGHGQGEFDRLSYMSHWLLSCAPVLWYLTRWDTDALQRVPLELLAHGRSTPLLTGLLRRMLVASAASSLSSISTAVIVSGSLGDGGAAVSAEVVAANLLHVTVWGLLALAATWWWGDHVAGQVVLLLSLLMAPALAWEHTRLPFGLSALGQGAAWSLAWGWLLPAVLVAALSFSRVPLPGQRM